MSRNVALPQYESRVLSTLNADGTRRWITPREVTGRLWKARFIVAWLLIILFAAIPWIRVGGKPAVLLDVMTRQFTVGGTTFRPTETLLLALLMLFIFVAVFLVTALLGRVWCGWGCPQTVYLEFVYRPIERLMLGERFHKRGAPISAWRPIAMYALFLVLSAHLANTFLAYFVGSDRLTLWTMQAPSHHPVAFGVFATTVALMMFNFAFFREQMCTIVCPYGRLQSALLDRHSLIIGYDRDRGEPRGNAAQRRALGAEHRAVGDCVECTLCVQVCPTAIDIRDGLQLECINCAQCIDACDGVMRKLKKPTGLIRYSTQQRLEKGDAVRVRYRLVIYPVLLVVIGAALVTLLVRRPAALVEQARLTGVNFIDAGSGQIETPIRMLVENRTDAPRTYIFAGSGDVQLISPTKSIVVGAFDAASIDLMVVCRAETFHRGSRTGQLAVRDGQSVDELVSIAIVGPFTRERTAGANPP